MTKKRIILYGLVIVILASVLVVKNSNYNNYYNSVLNMFNGIWNNKPAQTNVKIQYDYGFMNNNKILKVLNNLKFSNPEQIEKFKEDLKPAIIKITEKVGIASVDFVESEKATRVVIRHEDIKSLHKVLEDIRKFGIAIKSMQISKPTDKYNLDIKVEL